MTNDAIHLDHYWKSANRCAEETPAQGSAAIKWVGLLGFVALTLWIATATSSAGHLVTFVR